VDNLGNAIGDAIVDWGAKPNLVPVVEKESGNPLKMCRREDSLEEEAYSPLRTYTPFDEGTTYQSLKKQYGEYKYRENVLADEPVTKPNTTAQANPESPIINTSNFSSYKEILGSSLLRFIDNVPANHSEKLDGRGALANGIVSMEQLKSMFPEAKQETLNAYLPEFNAQLPAAGINTPKRLAYFFATVMEETAGMTEFIETKFLFKDPARAKEFFPTNLGKMTLQEIKNLGHGELFANTVYANNHTGNGDASTGDGYRFRGRGVFHLTGRDNYRRVGGQNYIMNPDLILIPSHSVKIASIFWNKNGLNSKVDALKSHISILKNDKVIDGNFRAAVKVVNAKYAHIERRARSYNQFINFFK
jgi:putative chitinase